MRGTEKYLTEEEYKEIFEERVHTMNLLNPMKEYTYSLDYAYGGVRLTKRKKATGGENDLSVRFFYDEDETNDYEAFKDMLSAIIEVIRDIKKGE